jgi:hypothetical protein
VAIVTCVAAGVVAAGRAPDFGGPAAAGRCPQCGPAPGRVPAPLEPVPEEPDPLAAEPLRPFVPCDPADVPGALAGVIRAQAWAAACSAAVPTYGGTG